MCEGCVDAKILIFDEIGNVWVKKCAADYFNIRYKQGINKLETS